MCSDNREILKIKNSFMKNYSENPYAIIADSKRENSIIREYDGRGILELIQNADDATDKDEGILSINLRNNVLIIENNGSKPFSFKGVMSLMNSSYSDKASENIKTIGNKGLGFRALLAWSDKISIHSEHVSIGFCREYARHLQEKILFEWRYKETKGADEIDFNKTPLPILIAPKEEPQEKLSPNMVTRIKIIVKEKKIDDIIKQLSSITGIELLFIKNLRKIIINLNSITKEIELDKKIVSSTKDFIITNVTINNNDKYTLYSSSASIDYYDDKLNANDTREYDIAIAFDETNRENKNRKSNNCEYNLFSYFETKIKSPFPFLVNASFDLLGNRNYLLSRRKDDYNDKLVKLLSAFIFKVVFDYYIKDSEVSCYDVLKKILIFKNESFLREYLFYDTFITQLKKSDVFPITSGEYINIESKNPIFINDINLTSILKNGESLCLLQYTDDVDIIKFINEMNISDKLISYEKLCKIINSNVKLYSIEDKAYLIKYIINNYGSSHVVYPNLLVDNRDNTINFGEKIYNIYDQEITDLPDWISIKFINSQLIYELLKDININTFRKHYYCFGILDFDDKIIFENIRKEILKDSITKKQIMELTNWLYEYFLVKGGSNFTYIKDVMKVIDKKGQVVLAKNTYLHQEFLNCLGNRLLYKIKNVPFLAKPLVYGMNREKFETLMPFFTSIGVNDLPKKIDLILEDDKAFEFLKFYPEVYHKINNNCEKLYIKVVSYEYIFEVLEKAKVEDIIQWLLLLDNNEFLKTENPETSKIIIHTHNRKIENPFILPSYITYALNQVPWIPTDIKDNYVKPMKASLLNEDLFPLYQNINDDFLKLIDSLNLKNILIKMGVKFSFENMSYSEIYNLMFELANANSKFNLLEKIYDELIIKYKKETDVDLNIYPEYNKFIKEGLILAQANGKTTYQSLKSVYYTNNHELCETLLNDTYFFKMVLKEEVDLLIKLFGIKKLTNYKIEIISANISKFNKDFRLEYKELIPFILMKKNDVHFASDFKKLSNTKFYICDEMEVLYASARSLKPKSYRLKPFDYVYLENDNKVFIIISKVSSIFEAFEEFYFSDALAEVISMILNASGQYIKDITREIIKNKKEDREKIIQRDYGDKGIHELNKIRRKIGLYTNKEEKFFSILKSLASSEEEVIKKISFADFDFENLNNEKNQTTIISIFNKLKIEIKDFNNLTVDPIDISDFWINILNNNKDSYFEKYKYYTFLRLSEENISERAKTFIELLDTYNLSDYSEIDFNIANFDIAGIFEKLFSVSLIKLNEYQEFNYSVLIEQNKKDFYSLYPLKENEHKNIDEEHLNHYALFKELALLDGEEIHIKYSELDKIVTNEDTFNDSINTLKIEKDKIERGYLAELYVYKHLVKKYGKKRVSWVSKNGETAKAIEVGNDSLHYDIFYYDLEDRKHFVEVKSVSKKMSFVISKAELEFGSEINNLEYYDIYLVRIEKNSIIKHYQIEKIFEFKKGQSIDNNEKFSIVPKEYIVQLKKNTMK